MKKMKKRKKSPILPHTNELVPHRRMLKSPSELKRAVVVSHNSPLGIPPRGAAALITPPQWRPSFAYCHPPWPPIRATVSVYSVASRCAWARGQTATVEDPSLLAQSGQRKVSMMVMISKMKRNVAYCQSEHYCGL
ncbi:hypothetical protein RRG08_042586 [Elysia crispata]|uniref:Uncharacterized protein n=1 Tax=Elysia crispata TaxID=231223 RepID=A0AAE0XPZ9_9GAST|nr:hypothetical protein RRG08_042586 [Elysia crispata]